MILAISWRFLDKIIESVGKRGENPSWTRQTRHELGRGETQRATNRLAGSLRKEGAGKTSEQIELLQLDKSGIKVAEYMTELPNRKLLEQKLHKAVELARKRLEAKPA